MNRAKFLVWLGGTTFGIIVAHSTIEECAPIVFNECYEQPFEIEHENKTKADVIHDILTVLQFSIVHYFLSDIETRLKKDLKTLFCFFTFIVTIPVFGMLGQINDLKTSVSTTGYSSWTRNAQAVFISALLILLIAIAHEIYHAHKEKYLKLYILSFLSVPMVYVVFNLMYIQKVVFHLHHWFIGYYISFFMRTDVFYVNIIYSILYGIFVQGSIAYGLATVFSPDD